MNRKKYIIKLSIFFLLASCSMSNKHILQMKDVQAQDRETLRRLNAQFIKNFINQDVKAHGEIIHQDFVCIENSGRIIGRDEYLKNWATDYQNSQLDTFSYKDEWIRIFDDMALVRATSVFTKMKDGKQVTGYSVYTDTYIKENGRWWCVQAHMTPVR